MTYTPFPPNTRFSKDVSGQSRLHHLRLAEIARLAPNEIPQLFQNHPDYRHCLLSVVFT